MAELRDISVSYRTTILHRIDPRVKVAALTGLSIAIFNAELPGMIVGTLAILIVVTPMRRDIVHLFSRLRGFLLVLTGVLVVNAVSIPGETLFEFWKISISVDGVQVGLLFYWRILIVILIGHAVSSSTSATGIRNAVSWIFQFVPFVPHQVLGDMVGLLVRFLPLILIRSHLITEAQSSRGILYRKNPVYRIRVFCISLLRQSFLSADQLSMAMASRCYQLRRPIHVWPFRKIDIFCLFSIGILIGHISCSNFLIIFSYFAG